ncbi:NAD(P)-dependent oxidoreductase [Brachybacterium sp. AOP43-C2-M15]|uniref:NAD(P)-dependent oxidoreductase n=1 Tax=Brachybacterium sp. AOP43-C2-M15 TaxID=3457661 RepID=UPI004034DA9F
MSHGLTPAEVHATPPGAGPAPTVSVLGLGPMGAPIARSLLAAGRAPAVWNRTRARAEELAAEGARLADTVAEAAADVVLAVLPDVPQLRSVLDEQALDAFAAAGTLLVITSTTGPEQVRSLAEDLADHGIRVLDCPMSGGVAGAAAGTLSLMVGGREQDVARALPVLETIGGTVTHLGPLGAGSLAKLCNQVVVAGTLASIAEALGLARAGGLDVDALLRVLDGGLASGELLTQKRRKLADREYSLGGSTDNQVKDLLYATAAMEDLGLEGRLTPVLLEEFREVVARGGGQLDHAMIQELFLRG